MDNKNYFFQERHIIYKERRRQARWAFNLNVGLTGVSTIVAIRL
ncbi:MAG: hypothetical protein VKL59_10935 [Nostocaceae cyanobacterium]|nr:hypothetical protein [Nostocaceae cyanobacterium]